MKHIKGEITDIQVTRMKHKKERRDQVNRYSMPHDYITYTISASENESNAATGRLCIILGKTAFEFMISKDFFAILVKSLAENRKPRFNKYPDFRC